MSLNITGGAPTVSAAARRRSQRTGGSTGIIVDNEADTTHGLSASLKRVLRRQRRRNPGEGHAEWPGLIVESY